MLSLGLVPSKPFKHKVFQLILKSLRTNDFLIPNYFYSNAKKYK